MKNQVIGISQLLREELVGLSKFIYENPELGNEEIKAAQAHCELLRKYNFEVKENFIDIKTAFKAEYDSQKPGPTIAFLIEYDALPGIGHGCGHNILGALSTGAAITLSKLIDEYGGKVLALGTPAEETNGAKVIMAQNGVFNHVDVAFLAHPESDYYESGATLAINAIEFEFFGKTAHAAASPEQGINALDACLQTFNCINALREHLQPTTRVHGIIKEGGLAANIVPEYAKAHFYIRTTTKAYLQEVKQKIINCAKGSAIATQATMKYHNYEYSNDNLVTNKILSDSFNEQLKSLGIRDIKAAKAPLGSSDMGNVSHICPVIHPYFKICENEKVIGHSIEFAAATQTDFAIDNMMITLNALVLTSLEIIKNEKLLTEIKANFSENK